MSSENNFDVDEKLSDIQNSVHSLILDVSTMQIKSISDEKEENSKYDTQSLEKYIKKKLFAHNWDFELNMPQTALKSSKSCDMQILYNVMCEFQQLQQTQNKKQSSMYVWRYSVPVERQFLAYNSKCQDQEVDFGLASLLRVLQCICLSKHNTREKSGADETIFDHVVQKRNKQLYPSQKAFEKVIEIAGGCFSLRSLLDDGVYTKLPITELSKIVPVAERKNHRWFDEKQDKDLTDDIRNLDLGFWHETCYQRQKFLKFEMQKMQEFLLSREPENIGSDLSKFKLHNLNLVADFPKHFNSSQIEVFQSMFNIKVFVVELIQTNTWSEKANEAVKHDLSVSVQSYPKEDEVFNEKPLPKYCCILLRHTFVYVQPKKPTSTQHTWSLMSAGFEDNNKQPGHVKPKFLWVTKDLLDTKWSDLGSQ